MTQSIYTELYQRYIQLRSLYTSQQITQQQFYTDTSKLQVRNDSGVWWTIDPRDGAFLRYEGQRWVSAAPPGFIQPGATPSGANERGLVQEIKSPSKKFLGILGLATPLITATCWLLYSWVVPAEENDCITPMIIGGIPLLFVYFRSSIDRMLLPFQPLRQWVPRFILYGLSLAFPFVLGYVCASQTSYGFAVPRIVSLLSLVGGYVLVRDPEVRK